MDKEDHRLEWALKVLAVVVLLFIEGTLVDISVELKQIDLLIDQAIAFGVKLRAPDKAPASLTNRVDHVYKIETY